jgi:CRP-like cAMP-binding protein
MLVERRFDVGATVVAEGEPGRSMFIVHSGELVVSKLGDSGRVIRMAGLEPGDFFGEMTLIEMQNRSATVVAESPTVLYELTARNLYTYYKADIHAYVMVLQNINRELCRRLRRDDNRLPCWQMLRASQGLSGSREQAAGHSRHWPALSMSASPPIATNEQALRTRR